MTGCTFSLRWPAHALCSGSIRRCDRSPPLLFVQLLTFTTHGDTVPYATRVLMTSGDPEDNAKPVWAWQARYATWSLLYALHTTEPERVATIASLGFRAEPEHGLTAVALRYFGEAPAQLSRQQWAMLAELLVLAPAHLSERELIDHATHLLDTFDQLPHRRPGERRGPASYP